MGHPVDMKMVRASGNAKRDRDIQMACGFFSPLLQVTAKLRYREQSEAGMLYEFLLGNVVRCLRLGEFRTADARRGRGRRAKCW